ncbi:hypothetical protein ACFL05_01000 [Patescibacteria group bacterium]
MLFVLISEIDRTLNIKIFWRRKNMHSSSKKLIDIFKKNGLAGDDIIAKPTIEDKRRGKIIFDFIKKVINISEKAGKSKLHLG